MRENKLQGSCIQWVREAYAGSLIAVNVHGGGYCNKGFPDLLVMGRGHVVAIELKSDSSGYGLQPDQKVWASRFRRARVPHYVTHDLEGFKTIIKEEFDEAESGV